MCDRKMRGYANARWSLETGGPAGKASESHSHKDNPEFLRMTSTYLSIIFNAHTSSDKYKSGPNYDWDAGKDIISSLVTTDVLAIDTGTSRVNQPLRDLMRKFIAIDYLPLILISNPSCDCYSLGLHTTASQHFFLPVILRMHIPPSNLSVRHDRLLLLSM